KIAPNLPEGQQRASQPQSFLELPVLSCPAQRRPQVVVLRLQPPQPGTFLRSRQLRLRLFRQRHTPGQVPVAHQPSLPRPPPPLPAAPPHRRAPIPACGTAANPRSPLAAAATCSPAR